MSNLSADDVGKKFTFSLRASNVIRGDYANVELLSMGTAASYIQFSPRELHEQIAGAIPSIAEIGYDQYLYYLFKDSNGNQFIIGDPWIQDTTIVREENAYITIRVYGAGSNHVEPLRTLLASRNYTNTEFTVHGGDL